jgi:hypothetical protein
VIALCRKEIVSLRNMVKAAAMRHEGAGRHPLSCHVVFET